MSCSSLAIRARSLALVRKPCSSGAVSTGRPGCECTASWQRDRLSLRATDTSVGVGGSGMREGISIVVFDVNETLSDMTPMGQRFADLGLPEHLAKLWFASLLRDGFALTASGDHELFSVLGRETLRSLLSGADLERSLD